MGGSRGGAAAAAAAPSVTAVAVASAAAAAAAAAAADAELHAPMLDNGGGTTAGAPVPVRRLSGQGTQSARLREFRSTCTCKNRKSSSRDHSGPAGTAPSRLRHATVDLPNKTIKPTNQSSGYREDYTKNPFNGSCSRTAHAACAPL